jgi:acetyl-CoA acetyltransferase
MSDGAAALLVMKASKAAALGQEVMGVLKGIAVVGCPPVGGSAPLSPPRPPAVPFCNWELL